MTLPFRPIGFAVLGVVASFAGCHRAPAPTSAPKPAASNSAATSKAGAPTPGKPTPNGPSDSTKTPRVAGTPGAVPGVPGGPQGGPQTGPRPYDQVIPKTAVSSKGLFTTHLVGTKVFFEIPKSALNADMLLVGRYAAISASDPMNGPFVGDQFAGRSLRWERRGHKILLRNPTFGVYADSAQPIARAVEASTIAPIMTTFDIAAYGNDSAAVIEVTALFTATPEFSSLGMRARLDAMRSTVERVVAFPENVEIEATQVGATERGPVTAVAHWSMVRLPTKPMMPRLYDARVGYFFVGQTDFGSPEYRATQKRFITRWRLEKKDPSAALSEPVNPIVYYIDPATPDYLKPFVKAGVEAWQPAFEAAGFKNAIIAKDVPVGDTTWSMEDVRHTLVRWLPSTQENAQGPHVADPRTGEILNGSVRMFHNILNLQRSWYFTQVAPLDLRAQRWPFPDTLMGKLVQYVVAHELGHTLGFPHNHKASSTYPLDSLRSVSWLRKMGHIPSLMDYARFNYVAQPEDRIPADLLIPQVGPYDKFATMWGYMPIPEAKTPEQERATLDKWARMQDTVPWYRFGNGAETGYNGNPDFGDAREAVGDADAVRATTLGIKNIKRIMPMLLTTAVKPGEDYSDLAEMYIRLVRQWGLEVGHVVNIIGGVDTYTRYGGQPGVVYTPVSRARQVTAMKFLADNVFTTPSFLLDANVLQLLTPEGGSGLVLSTQESILKGLLSTSRINRMAEFQARAVRASDVYSITDLLGDLRRSLWSELKTSRVAIDLNRRNLQRTQLRIYDEMLNPKPSSPQGVPGQPQQPASPIPQAPGELVAGIRAELVDLQSQVSLAMARTANRETRAHLLDVSQRIRRALDPK